MRRTPLFASLCLAAAALTATAATNQVTLLEKAGKVEAAFAGTNRWLAAETNLALRIDDRIRTGERSRATLHLLDQSTMRMAELTEFLVEPLNVAPDKPSFNLGKGLLYFFHRDKPVDVQFKTRTATAAIRGTEFHLAVADNGRTVLTMFDGEVKLSNQFGAVELHNGEQGTVEPGQAPVKSPALNARSVIQWCLYYPGVLDVDELRLDAAVQNSLAASLDAYRSGDLLAALEAIPTVRPSSEAGTTYYAALLLGVGKAEEADTFLAGQNRPAAAALRALITTVRGETNSALLGTNSATESLVRSYQLQAQSRLPEALAAAQTAVTISPQFGFGWARVAELEFSFGHTAAARAALDKALALSPRNAQAVALRGFTFAARNRITDASAEFDRAIVLDGALGNAWLGRGLCRIRRGDLSGGRADLQVAATLEPQRALLRSYLAKAWTELGDAKHATNELALARERDANDPTAWLYSALLLQQENRINEAVNDLERSQELNDNRRIYRSQLLLDQDRAVRGANLANIYRDAGMTDVSVREASTAVNADYANYSAHLFLANSYNDLRDPQGVNLRYETSYLSEFLVANLLAPVGAGTLSQQVSQQEYSKFFERDGLSLSSSTEYTSHGNWRQGAALTGRYGNSEFAAEGYYNSLHGYRPNSDLELTEYNFRIKQQLTPQDSILIEAALANSEGGNLAQYYNQADAANAPFRFKDEQEPILVAGYHHEWSPASHTLFLAGRLSDDYTVANPLQPTFLLFKDDTDLLGIFPFQVEQDYQSKLEIYTFEAQQIWQTPRFTTVFGGRAEFGDFTTQSEQRNFQDGFADLFPNTTITNQNITQDFERESVYLYEHWKAADTFMLIGGVSGEWLTLPANHRATPLIAGEESSQDVLPKAGAIWTPSRDTTVRAGFTKSVGGASFDQSFQLEPTQVAGFNQAFRSLIPESVDGANTGAKFTTYGVSLEQKLASRTYLNLLGEWLESKVERTHGAFEFVNLVGPDVSTLNERLNFREQSASLSLHQLVGSEWAFGATYRISRASLKNNYTDISNDLMDESGFPARTTITGIMQTLDLHAIYQLQCGFFARLNGTWTHQSNDGYQIERPSEDFWQWNIMAGYRFPRRQAEIVIGVLNLTDQDYKLSPLNLHLEPPRDRTFAAQFNFHF